MSNCYKPQLDFLFEYSPDLISIYDFKGNIIDMNNNLLKALGYKSKEKVLKMQIKDVLIYEKKELIVPKFLKLIINKSNRIEYNFITKKKKKIPVEGYGFPCKKGDLDVIVIISSIIDDKKKLQKDLLSTKLQLDNLMTKIPEIRLWALTQKKNTIDILQKGGMVLKESEKKYKEILENIKEGYFEVDLEGNLVFYNEALCEILGYPPEELIGKNFRSFIDLTDKKIIDSIKETELHIESFEFELSKKNRERIYIETSISEKKDFKGTLLGFYGLIRDVSKRKKAEEKLKSSEQNLINLNLELEERIKLRTKKLIESEERYRNLIETTPAIIQSVRLDGTFIFINQTWLDTFGYTREEVHSLNLVDVIHPESQQHCQNLFSRIMQGESIFDIEATFVTKDGQPIYVEGNANPYFTDDKVTATRGIFYNVTERKKAEQKVKESEERYHNLFESSPVMISLIDSKGKIIEVNPASLEGYGFKKEDFINKDFKEVYTIPPKYLPILAEKFKELFAKGVLEPMELQFYTKDRERIWATLQASLVKIRGETYIQAIIQDINEQKKAEQKVKESEEKYRLITENINDMIYVLNEKFEFEYINASVHERLMGYSENDLIGRSSINFIHSEDVKKSMRALRNVTKGGMGKEGMEVIRIRDKKNIYHWLELKGKTFIDRDNKKKALLVARDVTNRIIADQKLKKSEELYHKAYDQVNFYKDLFTHDISNILQMIKSTVELSIIYLNDPKKLNEIQEIWNKVNSQVNRGSRLVSNVRRLSQIEYTQVPIQSIEVFSFLHEAIEYTQKGIQERKINFQIDSIFRTYNIKANELLLDVFENIIINSIRYNDNSVIEILIKISKLQKDGIRFLKMEFMDNGTGISDDRKKIIFQKGYKKEKQSKGMGLGLSLVKKIIESYNGQIWVEDKIKGDFTKGSNFIILIPEE